MNIPFTFHNCASLSNTQGKALPDVNLMHLVGKPEPQDQISVNV